jgi:hypothetical protein
MNSNKAKDADSHESNNTDNKKSLEKDLKNCVTGLELTKIGIVGWALVKTSSACYLKQFKSPFYFLQAFELLECLLPNSFE